MARTSKFDDEQILDRAMEAIWRRGWSHTSIRDLEQAVGLKAPSIYRRFGSKEGLGVAVIDFYVDRVVKRRIDRHLSGNGDPIANIVAFLERSVSQPDHDQRLRGCLLTTTALQVGVGADGDAFAGALRRGLAEIEAGLRREVERAAAQDRLSARIDPDSAVAVLLLATQGLMALARAGTPAPVLQARARAAVAAIAGP